MRGSRQMSVGRRNARSVVFGRGVGHGVGSVSTQQFHVARATIFASFGARVGHWKFGADDARNERHGGFFIL